MAGRKQYRNRQFNFGLNSLDAEHAMGDAYSVIAKDVVVGNGFIETRNGYTLFGADATRGSGGVNSMAPYYDRAGAKRLVFATDDDWFLLLNTSAVDDAWNSIATQDFGTAVNNPFAYQYQNGMFLGTGLAANTQRKLLAATFSAVTTQADASADIRFAEYHQGANIAYLLGGGNVRDDASHHNSILYYTTDIDAWNSGGTITIGSNDGQSLTAIKSHSNILAYKDNSAYKLDIVYESSAGVNIIRVLERFQDIGAVNQEVCQVALNDIISLSQRHGVRGFQQVQTQLGGSGSRRYSTKIKPLLNKINWSVAATRARAVVWDDKYFLSVPIDSSTNNAVFVAHLDQVTDLGEPPWTVWDMSIGSFSIFQDTNGEEILLMGDADSPKIYKYDKDSLTDNQTAISAKWRSKKIDLGDMEFDEQEAVIIGGQMTELTRLQCTVYVDGIGTDYMITAEQIVNPTDPIWSHVIGSEIIGGNTQESTKPRFLAVLPLPDSHRVGSEIQIELKSAGNGFYWRVDYLSINEELNDSLYPYSSFVSTET